MLLSLSHLLLWPQTVSQTSLPQETTYISSVVLRGTPSGTFTGYHNASSSQSGTAPPRVPTSPRQTLKGSLPSSNARPTSPITIYSTIGTVSSTIAGSQYGTSLYSSGTASEPLLGPPDRSIGLAPPLQSRSITGFATGTEQSHRSLGGSGPITTTTNGGEDSSAYGGNSGHRTLAGATTPQRTHRGFDPSRETEGGLSGPVVTSPPTILTSHISSSGLAASSEGVIVGGLLFSLSRIAKSYSNDITIPATRTTFINDIEDTEHKLETLFTDMGGKLPPDTSGCSSSKLKRGLVSLIGDVFNTVRCAINRLDTLKIHVDTPEPDFPIIDDDLKDIGSLADDIDKNGDDDDETSTNDQPSSRLSTTQFSSTIQSTSRPSSTVGSTTGPSNSSSLVLTTFRSTDACGKYYPRFYSPLPIHQES